MSVHKQILIRQMSGDKITVTEGLTNTGDRIRPLLLTMTAFGGMVSELLARIWTCMVWFPCFAICKKFWLAAPHLIGGHEGRPVLDICSTYFGVNNSLLYTDVGQRCFPSPPHLLTYL